MRISRIIISLLPFAATAAFAQGQGVKLTLSDAVNRALGSSSKVKQAEHDRDAQVEKRRGAWSDVGPRLRAEYTDVRFRDEQTAAFGPQEIVIRPERSQVGSLTAIQPITGAFALVEKARFEGAQEDLKDNTLKLSRSDALYGTVETYLKAYEAQEQLLIAEQSITAAGGQQKDAQALERAGRLNRGDVLKLDLAVSEAKARAADARAGREIAFAALRVAIGLPADAPLALDVKLPDVPAQTPDVKVALREAQDKRLEVQQAAKGVDVAAFGTKLAYTQFTPTVNLFSKLERNFGEMAGLGGGGERNTRSYGIQASWDIWQNGSSVFAVREAAEQRYMAEEMARGVNELIRIDVTTAIARLKASHETLDVAKVAVNQAAEAYRIEKVRFRSGTRSATDLVLAETSQAGARARLVSARSNLVLWHLKVQKALGVEQPKLQ